MPDAASGILFDCIVLGAGIAGVTAARDLQHQGSNVLLLEGSDRVGGRMYSKRTVVQKDGKFIPLEAGAEYIHVEHKERYKEFWDEILNQGFSPSEFSKSGSLLPPQIPRNRVFFDSYDRTVPVLLSLSDGNVFRMVDFLFALQKFDPTKKEDVSAKAYLAKRKEKFKKRGKAMAEYTLSAHTPGLLDAISIGGLSADGIPDQFLEPSEFRLELRQDSEHIICGYDALPARIVQRFLDLGGTLEKSHAGQTNMKVIKVERSGTGIITVKTQGGDTFSGRSAVCTFSVGMLNPDTGEGDAIFGTLLTKTKRTALDVVTMGPITKFSLEFRKRWWKRHGPWSGQMTVLSYPEGEARTFFSAFPDQADGPHVLTALLMSKDHETIRVKSDPDAIQHLLDVLQKIYDPKGKRWTPARVLAGTRDEHGNFIPKYSRQDWAKDEFAKGGNSFLRFIPKGQSKMHVTKVREALKDPRETLPLFWAGEATAPAYDPHYQPLSVHGAYISGVRVAEDVHRFLKVCNEDAECFNNYYKEKYFGKKKKEKKKPIAEDVSDDSGPATHEGGG